MTELSPKGMRQVVGGTDYESCTLCGASTVLAASAASISGGAGLIAMSPAVTGFCYQCAAA